MNVTTRLFAATAAMAVTAVLLVGPASAQSADAPRSRAAVNEATRAANMARQLMPPGEGSPTDGRPTLASSKTRAERKAETLQARRDGAFKPGGLGLYLSHMSQRSAVANSTRTRAERKAETLEAARHGELMHAGEAG